MRSCFFILIIQLFTLAQSYSVSDILKFIDEPIIRPDFTITAKARGGYGLPEMYASKPQTDAQAQLLCQMDILSTAEIRDRKRDRQKRHSLVLDNLSEIISHQELINFLYVQKSAYTKRKNILSVRIKKGFSEQSEVFPVERFLIDIETKIKIEQSSIRKAQLKIAGLASSKWEELFKIVKNWDNKL